MKEIKLKGLDEVIYEHESECGLKTYIWPKENVSGAFMSLAVLFGSIHTEFKVGNKSCQLPTGVAHFLEHVKFNINANTTAHSEFQKLGSEQNAFTTFKYTSYWVYACKELMANLNLLLDFVYTPYFTKQIINKEKGIILEEANMGLDDVYDHMIFSFYGQMFNELNYRHPIVGTPEDIKSITLEDIKAAYNAFYHPKNMYLCVTGNVNPYEIAKVVDENLSKKKFKPYQQPKIIEKEENRKVAVKEKIEHLNVTMSKVRLGLKMPRSKFKKYPDLELGLYMNLLINNNFGNTSEFKQDLIDKELIHSIYATFENYGDFISIVISFDTDYPEEVIKLTKKKLDNLSFNEKDFNRKKKCAIASLILQYEDIEIVNNKMQRELVTRGKICHNLKEIYEALNLDDMNEICSGINTNNMTSLIVKPKQEVDE